MTDNKQLAIDISLKIDYTPTDDRILVKPLKPIMVSKLVPVPPMQAATNIDEAEKQEPTEPKKMKVEANVQKGIVIKLGSDFTDMELPKKMRNIEVGDIVYFPRNGGIPFEALKDSRMLRRYELLAVEKYNGETVVQ